MKRQYRCENYTRSREALLEKMSILDISMRQVFYVVVKQALSGILKTFHLKKKVFLTNLSK